MFQSLNKDHLHNFGIYPKKHSFLLQISEPCPEDVTLNVPGAERVNKDNQGGQESKFNKFAKLSKARRDH